jgi:hypothetical protein
MKHVENGGPELEIDNTSKDEIGELINRFDNMLYRKSEGRGTITISANGLTVRCHGSGGTTMMITIPQTAMDAVSI